MNDTYDVLIVGGGPAGLSAALTLGRARRRVLLCDAGERRNAKAVHVQGFVTRDGIAPAEFRRIAREQLAPYTSVEFRDVRVDAIGGERGAFVATIEGAPVGARRVLLCNGLIDVLPEIEGFREHWGTSIFQCPYCHGWEARDRAFGYLSPSVQFLEFALLLRGWTERVAVLTDGRFEVPAEVRERLVAAGVAIDERPIARMVGTDRLEAVAFTDGGQRALDVLFARPPQRQVALVQALGVALDPHGFVQTDPMWRETSIPGVYAAGDLATGAQSAIIAAAAGMQAASVVNHSLASGH